MTDVFCYRLGMGDIDILIFNKNITIMIIELTTVLVLKGVDKCAS